MKLFINFVSLLLFTANIHASRPSERACNCLNDSEARTIVADFAYITGHRPGYRDLAERRLTRDFKTVSDSYAFTYGNKINETNTSSLDEFLTLHTFDPKYETLFLSHTCDTIAWYSTSNVKAVPHRGIHIFFIDLGTRKIYKVYNEHNSGALMYNVYGPGLSDGWEYGGAGRDGPRKGSANCKGCGRH